MHKPSGRTWAVGDIANGHVLTASAGWVRLNAKPKSAGPWRPGDVVGEYAFTGEAWVALPPGWRRDPTGRHQFRWWTGQSWSYHALTNGLRIDDPLAIAVPPMPFISTPARKPPRIRDVMKAMATVIYCGIWFLIAIYSAATAWQETEAAYLALTSTASLNILLYLLTGKTRSELREGSIAAIRANLSYLFCGAIAAGGIWLSLHFNSPDILLVTLFVVVAGLMFSWAIN